MPLAQAVALPLSSVTIKSWTANFPTTIRSRIQAGSNCWAWPSILIWSFFAFKTTTNLLDWPSAEPNITLADFRYCRPM
jgi:hypothetical protein